MNRVQKLQVLREGFSENTIKHIRLKDDWVLLRAIHESDLSDISLPVDVRYDHCLFHEVVKCGPNADVEIGVWCVVIRNALDALTADRKIVLARKEHIVLDLDTEEMGM